MRRPDWRERLNILRTGKARKPFCAAKWNCGRWAAAAVKAQTGVDHFAEYRPLFTTARKAKRALVSYSGDALAAAVTKALGESVHPAFAGDGDIVLSVDGVGVMRGDGLADFVGDDGFVRVKRAALLMAWKV